MIRIHPAGRRTHGFTLLEVMISVVVLATGLLSLAALQGSLARSSADAKVRGRVAAMLSARMDEIRAGGYGPLAVGTTTTTSTTDPCDADATDWIDCTRVQAGLDTLSVEQVVAIWTGTSAFAEATPSSPNDAQFKRIKLTAKWSDASAGDHQLELVSDISELGLTNSLVPAPEDLASGGAGGPVVRTTNPATAGVIPIALGNGDSSAASNPTPELVGQKNNQEIVGTRFNVLTYTPSGSEAVIQKRFENDLIKCKCQYGAGGNNLPEIYRTAQWPAVWNGDHYEVYKPSTATQAPGQSLASGPQSGVTQSPLCMECCRDHHDTAATGVAKFDPERSDGYSKYQLNGANLLVTVPDTSNATYVNACRIIRVDGFWRTASDMYARNFGLLETQSVGGVAAKSGLPTTAATDAYTTFVKDYLSQYDGTTGTAPAGARTMFDDDTRGLNVEKIEIATPSTTDYRYLHGRGLYVDYLEEAARDLIAEVVADTDSGGRCDQTTSPPKAMADCVLPYLPFTSANLTEIAAWTASLTSVLGVNSGNLLATDPSEPSGGRTFGKANGTADNTATIRLSNSGIAVNTGSAFASLGGVDPLDDAITTDGTDAQTFEVGGGGDGGGGTGDEFRVTISGGGANPFVFYTVPTGGADTGECIRLSNGTRPCTTNSTLPQSGTLTLSHYNVEGSTAVAATTVLGTIQCTYNGSPVTIKTNGNNSTIDVPSFRNYSLSAASIGGVPGTIGAAQDDGKTTETTSVSFGSIAAGATAALTFTEQTGSPILATLVSCTASQQGNNYYFATGTWTKPWEP